ncbi:MAG: 16S rRNA (cytosine(1402)-N(4))-methyltransferase RsmH [Eubacterium sp.]|nr:16S rRNA (cytosine(1402)-N(4))-methyltransferase RsmH [Eubacterium sp.]
MKFEHVSVLLNETIDNLNIKPNGIYVDGTLGGAGHSYEIAKRLGAGGRLIGIDQDRDAINAASERLAEFGDKVTIVKSNFSEMDIILRDLGVDKVDGILLDIGVSSFQFDNPERGFSYREEAPLDMRMDRNLGLSAYEVINQYDERELVRIFRDYGEEKYAVPIAKAIVKKRQGGPVETTFELNDLIKEALPAKEKAKPGHPSKKVFQALRIEVNGELDVLENSIDGMIDLLNPHGRLAIITFHSLEDRIVKQLFKKNMDPCICPPDFPVCVCGRKSKGFVVTRKPIVPSEEELIRNRRAKSSKLRVFERGAYD